MPAESLNVNNLATENPASHPNNNTDPNVNITAMLPPPPPKPRSLSTTVIASNARIFSEDSTKTAANPQPLLPPSPRFASTGSQRASFTPSGNGGSAVTPTIKRKKNFMKNVNGGNETIGSELSLFGSNDVTQGLPKNFRGIVGEYNNHGLGNLKDGGNGWKGNGPFEMDLGVGMGIKQSASLEVISQDFKGMDGHRKGQIEDEQVNHEKEKFFQTIDEEEIEHVGHTMGNQSINKRSFFSLGGGTGPNEDLFVNVNQTIVREGGSDGTINNAKRIKTNHSLTTSKSTRSLASNAHRDPKTGIPSPASSHGGSRSRRSSRPPSSHSHHLHLSHKRAHSPSPSSRLSTLRQVTNLGVKDGIYEGISSLHPDPCQTQTQESQGTVVTHSTFHGHHPPPPQFFFHPPLPAVPFSQDLIQTIQETYSKYSVQEWEEAGHILMKKFESLGDKVRELVKEKMQRKERYEEEVEEWRSRLIQRGLLLQGSEKGLKEWGKEVLG